MNRKSRYSDTPPFSSDNADPFGKTLSADSTNLVNSDGRFKGLRPRDIKPAKGLLEHTVASGDRLDRVAGHYFERQQLWYRIADANSNFLFAPDMFLDLEETGTAEGDPLQRQDMIGRTILIPKAEA